MVRYARAKGSKSSNEKIPNEATPWSVMQKVGEKVKQKNVVEKKKNAKELLKEKEEPYYATSLNTNTEWADFGNSVSTSKKKKSIEIDNSETNNLKKEKKEKRKLKRKNDNKDNVETKNEEEEEKVSLKRKKNNTEKNKNEEEEKEEKPSLKRKNDNTEKTKNEEEKEEKPSLKRKKGKTNDKTKNEEEKPTLKQKNDSELAEKKPILTKRQKRNLKKRKQNEDDKEQNKMNENTNSGNKFNQRDGQFQKGEFNQFGRPNMQKKIPRHNHTTPAKIRDDKEHSRRKPDVGAVKMVINGIEVDVVKYDGFPVRKEDADRLKELRQEMVIKGIPKTEINHAMKLERRKAEKALARIRKQVCFLCRNSGHNLSDCPNLNKEQTADGICFKCGSTEHTHFECKVNKTDDYRFANCFICRQKGHIAKQCPDNPKGLYPNGGACNICGDVTHLKKDCPDLLKKKEETTLTVNTISGETLESLDEDLGKKLETSKAKQKVVRF